VLLSTTGALVLLAFYRGFISQQKVGLQNFKLFSSLLVEFSVSFRVIVVEQIHIHRNLCQRLQMAKADDIGCGRDGLRQLKRDTCTTAHRRPYQQDRQHLKKSQ